MPAIFDSFIQKYFSKKLFSYFIVTGVTVFAAIQGYDVPEGFYHMSIGYVGGQSFVDCVAKYKAA